MLFIVTGPPAAGKSTWVRERAKPTDIVVDFDVLAVALSGQGGDPHDHPPTLRSVARSARDAAIDTALRHSSDDVDVYVIHSSPGDKRMADYRAHGAEVVTIDPGRDVCRSRCKAARPRRMFAVIDEWYREHEAAQPEMKAMSPTYAFPVATPSREW
jgi:hypothetical protein